eukprot:1382597-Rhodomonas_salina.1
MCIRDSPPPPSSLYLPTHALTIPHPPYLSSPRRPSALLPALADSFSVCWAQVKLDGNDYLTPEGIEAVKSMVRPSTALTTHDDSNPSPPSPLSPLLFFFPP